MKHPKGFALATILVLLGVILFSVGALLSTSVLESKISRSQQEGTKAYYAAEAGAEDALWRLGTNSTYNAALVAGNLNVSYNSTANVPAAGQSFQVTMVSTAPQYATVTIVGTSNNSYFTAQRQLTITAFQGTSTSPTGNNAVVAGTSLTITNGNANTVITGGDLYGGSGGVSFHSAQVNLGSGFIRTPGNYTRNGSGTVTDGGINAANNPPAATPLTIPGIDFVYYSTRNTVSYTPAQFQALFTGSTVNLPGPVTYVSGSLNMSSWFKNKTLNITGMLIINGSLNVTNAATGSTINVADPGNGQAGIFVNGSITDNTGVMNINGVLYSASNINFNNIQGVTINGGMISAGSTSLNTGVQLTVNYVASRMAASFSAGSPTPVRIQHWEEQY